MNDLDVVQPVVVSSFSETVPATPSYPVVLKSANNVNIAYCAQPSLTTAVPCQNRERQNRER